MPAPRPVTARLIGRVAEVGALVEVLASAADGRGQAVAVEGEAGSGKTRLVTELVSRAADGGFDIVVGTCDELAVGRSMGALVEALALDSTSPDPERAEIGLLLGGDAGSQALSDLGYRIVERVEALLERLTAVGPLVVVIEDLHWADAMTLRVVRAMGRALPALPLALVVTLRAYPRSPELGRLVADLAAGGGLHLALGALDAGDVSALAAEVAGAPVDARMAAHLARTGGNPLFVVEVVRALRDEATLAGVPGPGEVDGPWLPPSVQATIRRRLGFLPAGTLEVIKVAAVMGTRFPLDHLAAVMATSAAQLLADLEAATSAGLLGDDGGALVFRHGLIRDAVYHEIPAAIRLGLHRQAARALAALGVSPALVAVHVFAGAMPGDHEAVDWLARAGRQVVSRSPAEAVVLFERAVELADPTRPDSDELFCELAPVLIQTGRAGDAQRLSRQILDRGPAPGVEVRLRRALGEVLWTRGWLEAALGELEEVARVPGVADADRVGPAALAASIRLFVGDPAQAVLQARRVLEEARRLDDHFARSLALETLAVGAAAEARVADATALAAEAVAVANRSDQPSTAQLHPHLYLGLILIDADRLADAEAALQEGRRRAEERGSVVWLPLYHWGLALCRVLTGQWDDALAEVEVALAVAEEVGTRLHVPFLHGIAAWVAVQRGDLARAQGSIDEAVREFLAATSDRWQAEAANGLRTAEARWPMEWGLWISGLIQEARGDDAQALALMGDAWAVAVPLRYLIGHRFFAPDLVRLALVAGNHELAGSVTAEVEEGSRRSGTDSAAGAALRCRGLVRGDPDMILAAVGRYRSRSSAVELGFALEDAGHALARAGRRPEAIAALEEALTLYDHSAAARPAARTEAALRALGVRRRRPSGRRRALAGWESLTDTELVVARLVAEGLTSRQVGERLFVSRRTVETHLAHVFAKLGVTSRAQLGAEVTRHA